MRCLLESVLFAGQIVSTSGSCVVTRCTSGSACGTGTRASVPSVAPTRTHYDGLFAERNSCTSLSRVVTRNRTPLARVFGMPIISFPSQKAGVAADWRVTLPFALSAIERRPPHGTPSARGSSRSSDAHSNLRRVSYPVLRPYLRGPLLRARLSRMGTGSKMPYLHEDSEKRRNLRREGPRAVVPVASVVAP